MAVFEDEVFSANVENLVQAEVIEYLKLVKIPSSHWPYLTAIEKDCVD